VLDTVILPVTVSALSGWKVTFRAAFWPAPKINGRDIPLALTSFAFTAICETVRLEFPVLVMVTLFELVLPAVMLPKLRLVGLADIVTDAAAPVPLTATVVGELDALLAIVIVPLRLPAVVGANCVLNVVLCPAFSVVGVGNPLKLNPAPPIVICEIVSDADPVFVSVKLCDFVWPSTTLPKS
jgi:hypothetical protein